MESLTKALEDFEFSCQRKRDLVFLGKDFYKCPSQVTNPGLFSNALILETNDRTGRGGQGSKVTLFVSSPGDVAHERRIARETVARLNAEFAERIVLDPYFWEYEPFDFSKSFQEQIPNTAAFDVVLCLLWSRLGSRLGASQKLPDGSPANSGTEYEITHALAAQKERNGLPELHVWINQTTPSFEPEPPEVHDERIAQWRGLKRFHRTLDEKQQRRLVRRFFH